MTLKFALWLSGILGAIALAMPALVEIGLWLLILPGLILMLAPTVFLYLATFAVIRMILPLPPGLALNAVAAALTLLLGWLVVQPWQIKGRYDFAQAVLPDVVPSKAVSLSGDIRIETDRYDDLGSTSSQGAWQCNALCAALLDSDGVTSVTIISKDPSRKGEDVTYRIVPKADGQQGGELPNRPGDIFQHIPRDPDELKGKPRANITDRMKALNAAWSLRLATTDTLIAVAPLEKTDQIIRLVASRNGKADANKVKIDRIEVTDGNGRPLLRKSIVTRSMLAAPIHFWGSGSMGNFKMGLGRKVLRFGPRQDAFKPIEDLFRHTSLARPHVADAGPAIIARLTAALEDATCPASDADFALSTAWFASIDWSKPLTAEQATLMARAISDPRVPITRPFYDGYERQIDPTLRDALGTRIALEGTTEQERWKLARLLAAMPQGTFKTMTQTERNILGSGAIRPQIYAFIPRLADRGAAGGADLLTIMKNDTVLSKRHVRDKVMEAVAIGFARLGPKAAAQRPEVEALLKADRDRKEYRYGYSNSDHWRIALIRMGATYNSIAWDNTKPEDLPKKTQWLKDRVARQESEGWSTYQ